MAAAHNVICSRQKAWKVANMVLEEKLYMSNLFFSSYSAF